ncbi:RepB family plasmid replication initiator protein [Staphylococcus epidermidis]
MLFTKLQIYKHKHYLPIPLNPHLQHIINSLTTNFTKFQLKQITHLKSTYSKHIFRILNHYKHTRYLKI